MGIACLLPGSHEEDLSETTEFLGCLVCRCRLRACTDCISKLRWPCDAEKDQLRCTLQKRLVLFLSYLCSGSSGKSQLPVARVPSWMTEDHSRFICSCSGQNTRGAALPVTSTSDQEEPPVLVEDLVHISCCDCKIALAVVGFISLVRCM